MVPGEVSREVSGEVSGCVDGIIKTCTTLIELKRRRGTDAESGGFRVKG
jgi:hypothetical protein